MDVFNSDNNEKNKDNNEKDNEQENKSDNSDDNQSDGKEDENKQDETPTSLEVGFDLSDKQMDEQPQDSEFLEESSENVLQKSNFKNTDQEYKVFTTEFDEIAKAESLEDIKETQKLRKKLRSTAYWFSRSNNKTCK